MTYLNLFLISLLLVFIIDLTDVVETIKRLVWRWVFKTRPDKTYQDFCFKPFECSLCMTWWCGLIYLCFAGLSWVNVAYVAFLAFFTPIWKSLLYLVKDFVIKLIDALYTFYDL